MMPSPPWLASAFNWIPPPALSWDRLSRRIGRSPLFET